MAFGKRVVMYNSANSWKSGPNPLAPDRLSPAERRHELCAILAAGLVRLRARQSSGVVAGSENSSLDFSLRQSGGPFANDERRML